MLQSLNVAGWRLQITGPLPDQPIWMALAAALPEPWSDQETGFIAMRERLINDEPNESVYPGFGPLQYHLPRVTQVQLTPISPPFMTPRLALHGMHVNCRHSKKLTRMSGNLETQSSELGDAVQFKSGWGWLYSLYTLPDSHCEGLPATVAGPVHLPWG